MARRPDGNPATSGLRGSVFSALAGRIRQHQGPIYPLYVGDTYFAPPSGAHLADQTEAASPGIHRYENPKGRPDLLETIADHRTRRDGRPVSADQVLVTTGATGGLSATVRALLEPGQRLILLTPCWPLIRGMSVSHGLDVVDVPFYDRAHDADGARDLLARAITPETAAVYVNWPNNPSGVVSPRGVIEAVVELARRHDLWIISDDVYEDYVYDGASLDRGPLFDASDRLLSVFSFSKAYGMAGNRVGYLVGPTSAVKRIGKLTTYLVYSVNTAGQRAAEWALKTGDDWLAEARSAYADAGRRAAERLGVPMPDGGTFLFVDVAETLDDRGLLGFMEDCLDDGLLVAPGEVFGEDYRSNVRVCFTCSPPGEVMAGVEVLARRLGL